MSYYSSGLITAAGELLNGPSALANGVLLVNADGSSVVSSIASILGFTPANDAQVVHLAGTETITGAKTYSGGPRFLNDGTGVALYIQSGQAIRGEGGLFIDATTNPLKLRQNASTRLETTSTGVLISDGVNPGTIQATKVSNPASPLILDGTEIQFSLNGAATPSIRFGGLSLRPWNTTLGLTLGSATIPWAGVFTSAIDNPSAVLSVGNATGGLVNGDSSSSSALGYQIATTGGQHGLQVVSNIQYLQSYNKTLIRNGTTSVFDSNGGLTAIANAVPSLPRGLYVTPLGSSYKAVVLQGKSGQTANLTEWQDSTGNVLTSVGPSGVFTTPAGMLIQGLGISTEMMLQFKKSTGANVFTFSASGAGSCKIQGDGEFGIETDSTSGLLKLGQVNGRTMIAIDGTTGIGLGYGVGIFPDGTVEIQDQTGLATTLLNITAGPTQTTNLLQLRDNADVVLSYFNSSGHLYTPQLFAPQIKSRSVGEHLTLEAQGTGSVFFRTNSAYRMRMDTGYLYPYINDMRLGTTTNPWRGMSYRSGASDPTTSDVDDGFKTTWKNTTSGEIRDWVNDGGVMKKSAAYSA